MNEAKIILKWLESKAGFDPNQPRARDGKWGSGNPFPDSKVKEKVYHGTDAEFDEFDNQQANRVDTQGMFFTSDKSIASGFGSNVVESYLSVETPVELDFGGLSRYYFDGSSRTPSEIANRVLEINRDLANNYIIEEALKTELDYLGWSESFSDKIDGVIMRNINDSNNILDSRIADHFVVFEPEQIRIIKNN